MKRSVLTGAPQKSAAEIEEGFRELARNAIIMEPNLPASRLGAYMIREAEMELLEAGAALLLVRYSIRIALSERMRAGLKTRANHPLFPDLDLLPDRVTLPDGRRPRTANLNLTQVRSRIKALKEKLETRVGVGTRKELEQWEKLEARMEAHAAQSRGITVGAVATLETGQ